MFERPCDTTNNNKRCKVFIILWAQIFVDNFDQWSHISAMDDSVSIIESINYYMLYGHFHIFEFKFARKKHQYKEKLHLNENKWFQK